MILFDGLYIMLNNFYKAIFFFWPVCFKDYISNLKENEKIISFFYAILGSHVTRFYSILFNIIIY